MWAPAYALLIELEDGFKESNLEDDPAGLTYAGVSRQTWDDWCTHKSLPHNWPPSNQQVNDFYFAAIWKAYQCDVLTGPADAVYLQLAANLPYRAAHQALQIAAGAYPDGIVGPASLAAVKRVSPHDLADALLVAQTQHYCDVRAPSDALFKGLMDRVATVRKAINAGTI